MTAIAEIQKGILTLSEDDYVQLRKWFAELDWDRWDRQIEWDSENGRLDFLISEVTKDIEKNLLRGL